MQESKDEMFDRLAKQLMVQTVLTENEIDKIVSSPRLYSSIRNKVNASAPVPRFASFRFPVAAAFASILVAVAIGFVSLRSGDSTQTVARAIPRTAIAENINKLQVADGLVDRFGKTEIPDDTPIREESKMQIQNASFRKPAPSNTRLSRSRVEKQPDLEFIPLVYTDDPAETVRGGRVIRVEMSRASLFAMGINIPLENGADTVKADLLVGPDGVPRAVRVPQ